MDGFSGALLNSRGNPLICTLFAAPKRRKSVLRGRAVGSNVPVDSVVVEFSSTGFFVAIPLSCGLTASFDMPSVDAVGRAKPLGFGIRVVTTDDELLSKRGIFVCFSSYNEYARERENEERRKKERIINREHLHYTLIIMLFKEQPTNTN